MKRVWGGVLASSPTWMTVGRSVHGTGVSGGARWRSEWHLCLTERSHESSDARDSDTSTQGTDGLDDVQVFAERGNDWIPDPVDPNPRRRAGE